MVAMLVVLLMFTGIATDATMSYYDSGSSSSPKIRHWDEVSWSSVSSAVSTGNNDNFHVLKASPVKDEFILAVSDSSKDVNVQVYNGSSWGNLVEVSIGINDAEQRGFDVAYESLSGDAVIAYGDDPTDGMYYRAWNGSSWSSQATVFTHPSSEPEWVSSASNPFSDEIVVVSLHQNGDAYAVVWNGSAWGGEFEISPKITDIDSTSPDVMPMDVIYEQQSGRAVVVYAEAVTTPRYRIWNGSSWSAASSLNSVGSSDVKFIRLATDPSSNTILMGSLDGGSDLNVQVWNGSSWGTNTELDDSIEGSVEMHFDVAFESLSGKGMVLFGDLDQNTAEYYTWTSGGGWSASALAASGNDDPQVVELEADPNSNEIFGMIVDVLLDVSVQRWTGSAWVDFQAVELGSKANMHPFDIEFKRYVPSVANAVTFVDPTPANGSTVIVDNVFINVTTNFAGSTGLLEWNGVNESMTVGNATNFYKSKTGLANGVYTYRVYVNHTNGTFYVSETRTVEISVLVVFNGTAMMSYYDAGLLAFPQIRRYNGSSWGAADSAFDTGGNDKFHVLESATTRNEFALAVQDGSADVNVQIFDGVSWGNLLEVTTAVDETGQRGFDMAYETLSGDLIIAYGSNNDNEVRYRVWNGSTWTSEAFAIKNSSATTEAQWIRLVPSPLTDEVILVAGHEDGDGFVQVWNGNSWTNNIEISANLEGLEGTDTDTMAFDAIYEQQSGRGVVVYAEDGSSSPKYRTWNGSSWSSELSLNSVGSSDMRWIRLAADPGSDRIIMASVDSSSDLNVQVWSGSSWGSNTELDGSIESYTTRTFDVAFETSSGTGLLLFGDSDQDRAEYYTWTNTSGWSTSALAAAGTTDPKMVRLVSSPASDEMFGMIIDDGSDVSVQRWTGSAWTDFLEVETGSIALNFPFAIVYGKANVTPPAVGNQVTFVAPTPASGADLNATSLVINVTTNFNGSTGILDWNGTNQTMVNASATNYYQNKTGLANGLYTYRVYVNHTNGTFYVTEARNVTINFTFDYNPGSLTVSQKNLTNCPTRICIKITKSKPSTYSKILLDPGNVTQLQNLSISEDEHIEYYNLTTTDLTGNWTVQVSELFCRLDLEFNLTVLDQPVNETGDGEPPDDDDCTIFAIDDDQDELQVIDLFGSLNITIIGETRTSSGKLIDEIESLEMIGEDLYGATDIGGKNSRFYKINPKTAQTTLIGDTGYEDIEGLAYDEINGIMYAISGATDQLLTINITTGAATAIANISLNVKIEGLAYDATENVLYAADDSTNKLLKINISTGIATDLGLIQLDGETLTHIEALEILPSSMLIGANDKTGVIVSISKTNAVATRLTPDNTHPDYEGMVCSLTVSLDDICVDRDNDDICDNIDACVDEDDDGECDDVDMCIDDDDDDDCDDVDDICIDRDHDEDCDDVDACVDENDDGKCDLGVCDDDDNNDFCDG